MSQMENSKELILEVLRANYPEADLETPFESLDMDSLDFLALVHDLECVFEVNFPTDAAVKFKSAADVVDWLESQQ